MGRVAVRHARGGAVALLGFVGAVTCHLTLGLNPLTPSSSARAADAPAAQQATAQQSPAATGQTRAKAQPSKKAGHIAQAHAASRAGLRASARLAHASAAQVAPSQQPKVRVVNGVKHYSDIE